MQTAWTSNQRLMPDSGLLSIQERACMSRRLIQYDGRLAARHFATALYTHCKVPEQLLSAWLHQYSTWYILTYISILMSCRALRLVVLEWYD